MPTPHNPTAAVRRALRKLGSDIQDARRRRRLPMAVVAERAFTSRSTLQKVEVGDTNVGIGNDSVGQALASAALPKHAHLKRPAGSPRDG